MYNLLLYLFNKKIRWKMSNTDIKYFTPEEANRTLPLVKKIVQDILEYSTKLKVISDSTNGDFEENREAKDLVSSIKSFMRELEEIGCHYKDWNFSVGLIDFPAIINNEEVYLCWKSDEEQIIYYHGLNDGFRGRKLIPEYILDEAEV